MRDVSSVPLEGRRDGETFDYPRDGVRLNRQHADVWTVIRDGAWRTLAEISQDSGHPEASVSARLRDFRKDRFGALKIDRRYIANGMWEYRLEVPAREPVQLDIFETR